MTSPRPNIVFIMPDQWRHDAFGFAGNPVVETPNIDALAARGAVFRGAHCESPACKPSRASILTGLHARDHGLDRNDLNPRSFPQPDAFYHFPQRLRDSGYYTAEIGKMHFGRGDDRKPVDKGTDLRDRSEWVGRYGFDYTAEEEDKPLLVQGHTSNYTEYLQRKGLLEQWRAHHHQAAGSWLPGLGSGPEPLDPEDTLDMFIARQACDFLRTYDREQPFFLWVAPIGPHHPLDAPAVYQDRYHPDEIPLSLTRPPELPNNDYGRYIKQKQKETGSTDIEWLRGHARHYYANCTQDDAVVGRVVSALEQYGFADNTWILFGSDHGEMLGDYGIFTKGLFYRSSVQIPCLVVPPKDLRSPRIVDELTQGFDISATILDIAGADRQGQLGQSLCPAMNGESEGREAVFSEIRGFCMLATKRYKLIVDSATATPQQLFDLENDPQEQADLCPEPQAQRTARMLRDRYIRPFLAGEIPEHSRCA